MVVVVVVALVVVALVVVALVVLVVLVMLCTLAQVKTWRGTTARRPGPTSCPPACTRSSITGSRQPSSAPAPKTTASWVPVWLGGKGEEGQVPWTFILLKYCMDLKQTHLTLLGPGLVRFDLV